METKAEHSQNLNLLLQSEFRELFDTFVPVFYWEINCSQYSHLPAPDVLDRLKECKTSQLIVLAKFPTVKLKTSHQHWESNAEKILCFKLKQVSWVPHQWVQKLSTSFQLFLKEGSTDSSTPICRNRMVSVSATGVLMFSLKTEGISSTWKCNLAATLEKRLSFWVAVDLSQTPAEWSGRVKYQSNCHRRKKENGMRF